MMILLLVQMKVVFGFLIISPLFASKTINLLIQHRSFTSHKTLFVFAGQCTLIHQCHRKSLQEKILLMVRSSIITWMGKQIMSHLKFYNPLPQVLQEQRQKLSALIPITTLYIKWVMLISRITGSVLNKYFLLNLAIIGSYGI